MATTTPSTHPAAGAVGAPGPAVPAMSAPDQATVRPAGALLIALVAACAYAAFAHGAVDIPAETRLQAALVVLAVVAAATWLTTGTLRVAAPRAAWWGAGLLAGFAVWSGVSLLWSVAPDRTWLEINRALEYVLVVVLAVAVGATAVRAIERVAVGLLLVVLAVGLYALGGKVAPGVNVPHLFDLNTTEGFSRLRAPLEYWNALALVCVFGVPIAVRIAVDAARSRRVRLAALGAVLVLIIDVGMTYSRGGILGLVTAVIVMTALGGARLRGLLVLAVAALAATPVLAVAFTKAGLTANGAALGARITDGRVLLAVIVVCGGALLGAGWSLIRLESRVRWSAARSRRVWRGLGVAAAVLVLAGVVGLAASERGVTGSISHAVSSFTDTRQDRLSDPVRIVSTNSGNRWVWWKEATGAFSDRPVGGYGAGSFPIVHKRYRTAPIPVAQPHSVPLQFLAETGLIGALLALGGLACLFAAALGRVRGLAPGRERDLGVALFAGACAWLVHGLYDWDWDIPGVTVPALLFLGVLCARPGAPGVPGRRGTVFGEPDPEGNGLRVAALAGIVLVLCAFLVSAVLPAWSESRTSAAQTAVTDAATPAQLEHGAAQAELAARLDPLTVRPLFVAAAIAQGRGRLLDARRYLLQAADRQPDNPDVWFRIAGLAVPLADRPGFLRAAHKMLELDPVNGTARALALRGEALLTPPGRSATATGTPLPAAPAAPAPALAPAPVVPAVPGPPAPGG